MREIIEILTRICLIAKCQKKMLSPVLFVFLQGVEMEVTEFLQSFVN